MKCFDNLSLWKHQTHGLNVILRRFGHGQQSFALFFEQGTGKTLTAICAIRMIWRITQKPMKTLILCPLIVVYNWEREFKQYAPEAVWSRVQCLTGTKAKRIKQFNAPGKDIYITNIDAVNTMFWQEHLATQEWSILVVDESQKFKTHNSQRTRALHRIVDRIPHKFLLSGTPILNSMQDIWAQFRIMSSSIFPENFYVFRKRYFEDKNAGMPKMSYFPNWLPKSDSAGKLAKIIEDHSMRVTKAEVLDLPPLVRQSVYVELKGEQKRLYREMEEHFITYIEKGEACVATIVLTKLLRCMQICNGLLPIEGKEDIKHIPCGKMDALAELLEDITPAHKVIVWANFIANYRDIEKVCEKLNIPWCTIRGGQTLENRQHEIDKFQHGPIYRVMIANQAAGGLGVNLTAASYMIYFSKNYSLNDDLQSEARAHRGGSEVHDKITRIDIITKDTIEEEVTEALRGKKELAALLLDIKRNRR